MKTYTLKEDLLLEIYNNSKPKIQKKIEDALPELMKPKSGWYKTDVEGREKALMYIDFENKKRYGFDVNNEWINNDFIYPLTFLEYLAPIKEVKERLIAELLRLGFVDGCKFKSPNNSILDTFKINDITFNGSETRFYSNGTAVFNEGKFAIPIIEVKEVTIEEIEKLYGHKVKIINNER